MMELNELEKHLGAVFQDKLLLTQALTHKSYLNENKTWPVSHNERLEFLGDAVVEILVTEFLFRKYPNKGEGELTAYRSALVCTETHAALAGKLGIKEQIKMSRGQARDSGRALEVILADAFEAVVGALYLDQGMAAVKSLLDRLLFSGVYSTIALQVKKDTKSRFQELAQQHWKTTPMYKVLEANGPDHDKTFVVGVYIGGTETARGSGSSKKHAEEEAARVALEQNGWIAPSL
jgi:ribonuclease-3